MSTLAQLAELVATGKWKQVSAKTNEALSEGTPAQDILKDGLMAGLNVTGERFKKNDCYIPEVLLSSKAMNEGMKMIEPLLVGSTLASEGKVIVGTVLGDIHDIGKNLVIIMLKGAGFEVIDLGINVPPEKFVEAVREHDVTLIGLSALLSTTMPAQKATLDALEEAGLRSKVKVMVGGAPVTQEYADKIGADGYAIDAATAVDIAKKLIELTK